MNKPDAAMPIHDDHVYLRKVLEDDIAETATEDPEAAARMRESLADFDARADRNNRNGQRFLLGAAAFCAVVALAVYG